jgi:hypothetical protein
MSTITTALARLARLARLAPRGRAVFVPLLVAGALAAGCGTVHSPAAATAAGGAGASPQPTAHGTPSQSPAPVPTVTGAAAAGQPECDGWPAHALRVTLPQFFDPVAAERCVTGIQTIAGKGQWETATLEKATSDLTPLMVALREPPAAHKPGTFCPELAMLPPQIVVISASGEELIPMLPVTGCGLVQSAVLAAIAALPWQPVSVRMIAPVSTPAGSTRPAVVSPKNLQTLANQPGVQPQ